jgi:hypothetical protein
LERIDMRKRDSNSHIHAIGGDRHPDELTGRPALTRAAAMRAVGEVVYAVRVGDLVKIGHTGDLAARFNRLSADEVLAIAPGTTEDERQLHDRLADHLHHGREWYYPTPGVLAVVNELRERLGQAPYVA